MCSAHDYAHLGRGGTTVSAPIDEDGEHADSPGREPHGWSADLELKRYPQTRESGSGVDPKTIPWWLRSSHGRVNQ